MDTLYSNKRLKFIRKFNLIMILIVKNPKMIIK